jgi:membrane-associated phospholipid phosphatase
MEYPASRLSRRFADVLSWRAPASVLARRFDWSGDTRTMLRLTLFTGAVAAAVIATQGLTFPLGDLWEPLATCGGLLGVAAFYQCVRPAPNFVLTSKALAVLVVFSSVYSVLMYAVASTGRPLADHLLLRLDATMGLSAPNLVRWIDARPVLAELFLVAYFSLIPQTIAVIVVLGFANRAKNLDRFLVRFMLSSLIAVVGFYFWPALGACGDGRLPVPERYAPTIEHIEALRSGAMTAITWRGAQGLITVPSFHTIWAVLLASAFAGSRLFWPLVLLNALVVASTVTTGMHYFIDVLAGLVISAIVIVGTRDKLPIEQGAQICRREPSLGNAAQ